MEKVDADKSQKKHYKINNFSNNKVLNEIVSIKYQTQDTSKEFSTWIILKQFTNKEIH